MREQTFWATKGSMRDLLYVFEFESRYRSSDLLP